MTTATATREHRPAARGAPTARRDTHHPFERSSGQPIVAAVDGSAAATGAVKTAARMARELAAPLVLVYVRRGPSWALGTPYYQQRLDDEQGRQQGNKAHDDSPVKAAIPGRHMSVASRRYRCQSVVGPRMPRRLSGVS